MQSPNLSSRFGYLVPLIEAQKKAKTEAERKAKLAAQTASTVSPGPKSFAHLLPSVSKDAAAGPVTASTRNDQDQPRRSASDARAEAFAIEMERILAQVEGREPRDLIAGPSQAHLETGLTAKDMLAVVKRRNEARATRRPDLIGNG